MYSIAGNEASSGAPTNHSLSHEEVGLCMISVAVMLGNHALVSNCVEHESGGSSKHRSTVTDAKLVVISHSFIPWNEFIQARVEPVGITV